MHALLQRLTLDHKRLIVLLEVLERQLADFHAGREHDLDLVCELVQYIRSYEDQVHHPVEALIFARFKILTDKKRLSVAMLEQQHQMLTDITRKFHNALESVMQGDVILRQDIEVQGLAMLEMLRDHVDLEDLEVFNEVEQLFEAADWAVIEAQVPKNDDPVFERPDPVRFRALLRHLARAQSASSTASI